MALTKSIIEKGLSPPKSAVNNKKERDRRSILGQFYTGNTQGQMGQGAPPVIDIGAGRDLRKPENREISAQWKGYISTILAADSAAGTLNGP